jgi:hypothetical protein
MDNKEVQQVGSALVHSNQIEAGKNVCDKLLDGPTHLTAGCQSGKTGVVIYAVNQFLNGFDIDNKKLLRHREKDEDFNEKMKRTQVIWINARSDNYLRDQTEKRLTEAFGRNKVLTRESISRKRTLSYNDKDKLGKLIGKVYIGHLCDLQIDNNDNLVQLKNVIDFKEPILLILDESHVGQDKFDRKETVSKDGKVIEYNIGVLDNFCKNLGIHLTQPKDKWHKRRYLLSMSATRPSWSVYIELYKKNFGENYVPQIVHLHPGKNYCGIAKDYDNVTKERFVQAEPFYDIETGRVSSQIANEVKTLPLGKCILIRCKLQDSDMMIKSLKKMGFKEGDYAYAYRQCGIKHHTAESLNEYLNDCSLMTTEKAVIFIENFLGAGATFPNVRIHAQFERHNKSNPTAHIQSVGRSFGYSDEYTDENGDIKEFNKKDAKYKIYCDLDIMKLYKDGFDTDNPVYSDSATKKVKRNTNEYVWECHTVPKKYGVSTSMALQTYFKNCFDGRDEFDHFFDIYSIRMAYSKNTEYLDLCDLVNSKIHTPLKTAKENQSIAGKVVCIDGGNSIHDKKDAFSEFIGYKNSYDELIDNVKKGNSWLCNHGVSTDTFDTHYVCVFVYKKKTLKKNDYKMKKDTMLSIA